MKRIWQNNWALSLLAGLANVLAFAPISVWPFIFLTPCLLFVAATRAKSNWEALVCGYLCSLVIMLGGFYWVVYVLHLFGHLPWWVAGAAFVAFCGFGALNFPVFTLAVRWLHTKRKKSAGGLAWYVLVLPAAFTMIEWIVPKLFPWAIAHTFYLYPLVIQVAELAGASPLSFGICSVGGLLAWWAAHGFQKTRWAAVPLLLWSGIFGFGFYREFSPPTPAKPMTVALIQANIGSLERLAASFGNRSLVQYTVDQHWTLTEQALQGKKPALLLWPETAMPFLLDVNYGYAQALKRQVQAWSVPLITGAYARVPLEPSRDYNAAFLLMPQSSTEGSAETLQIQQYEKNVLLAFGEYFPLGDTFPILYKWFPQVSDFKRGTEQKNFFLADGTRVGVTVCYEAIIPSFVRKVARDGIQVLVNLTNDSWFGPTSEPHQHAALSVFRAVETRTPLVRVTNTGKSLTVDRFGNRGPATAVFAPGVLTAELEVPLTPQRTFFVRWGDWFIWLCGLVVLGFIVLGNRHVPIFSRIAHRR